MNRRKDSDKIVASRGRSGNTSSRKHNTDGHGIGSCTSVMEQAVARRSNAGVEGRSKVVEANKLTNTVLHHPREGRAEERSAELTTARSDMTFYVISSRQRQLKLKLPA